jgi:ribosomal-protein-serine acetyltransferase
MPWCHADYTEAESIAWIEIVAASENEPSRRVAGKAHAQFERVARNRLVIDGVPLAAAVCSSVPDVDS